MFAFTDCFIHLSLPSFDICLASSRRLLLPTIAIMPNPLDCPREIRDMIFSMYFADVLKVGSQRCRQRDDDWGQNILTVKHAVAREAAGVHSMTCAWPNWN